MVKTNNFGSTSEFSKMTTKRVLHLENIGPILMQINRNKLEEAAKKTSKLIARNSK
jgi:hypothetical protein